MINQKSYDAADKVKELSHGLDITASAKNKLIYCLNILAAFEEVYLPKDDHDPIAFAHYTSCQMLLHDILNSGELL